MRVFAVGFCGRTLIVAGKRGGTTGACVKRNKTKMRSVIRELFALYVDLPFMLEVQGGLVAQQPSACASGYDEIRIPTRRHFSGRFLGGVRVACWVAGKCAWLE